MMSTSSVRRLKDRGGGGGGKVTANAVATKPSRSVTPVSEKLITRSVDSVKKPVGKENASRPTSRIRAAAVSQKPVMKPVPRTEKSTSCAGDRAEMRARRSSSSSVPRGRSSSPSEFVRSRSSRVSIGEIDRSRVSEKFQVKKGAFRDSDVSENGISNSKLGSGRSIETGKSMELKNEKNVLSRSKVLDVVRISSISSSSSLNSEPNSDSGVKGVVEKSKLKSEAVEKRGDAVHLGLRESLGKSVNRLSLEGNKEKGMKEENVGGRTANKYPSKLHEKLAFLEGKVKRIASDIKRTKEMLDMNNPDASKVILSDIQDTVAGIEKAMGHVVIDDQKTGLVQSDGHDNLQNNVTEKCPSKLVDDTKSSLKGLNTEELEARFFPHHKLLRDRTSLKASSGNSQIHDPMIDEQPISELKVEEKLLTSVDENLIAMEFLDSLSKDMSKVTARGGNVNENVEICEVQEIEDVVDSSAHDSSHVLNWKDDEIMLTSNEKLEDFDSQGNVKDMKIEEETEDSCTYELNDIGYKTCTGGWFVSEGESVLLAHGDGSCSFYDITNCEEKTEYKPPDVMSPNIWQDCWILRAPGTDGSSGRYVVAASAGKSHESGFCSWDFYNKEVQAFTTTDKDGKVTTRKALAPLPNNNPSYMRNAPSSISQPENPQWWYRPCGPLIISTATCQKVVKVYDIRDGERIMLWQLPRPVLTMDYSSPLQWRNRGKVVLAETEGISLWDVESQNPGVLLSISSAGRKISALHINNTDVELGGGVRQRVSSSEAEGNDGVFCTVDSINILDFRTPSGIGLKIPKLGTSAQSVFSRGDSIYLGCTNLRSTIKKNSSSLIQQFSIRKQRLFSTYTLPECNAISQYTALTQVYGNSNIVMGVCGVGQFVFDALKDDEMPIMPLGIAEYGSVQKVKEVIGHDDYLYYPSFDYLGSRLLLISRDRPAQWRYLL